MAEAEAAAHSIWLWVGFAAIVGGLLAVDLGLLNRRPHEIGFVEALKLSAIYILLAAVFAAGLFYLEGTETGLAFTTGYLIEKSLSLDNIFVFVLIFGHFAVPAALQHRALFWGIMGALVLRAILILVGAALIAAFSWILYLFGLLLLASGIKMLLAAGAEPDLANNRVLGFMRRRLRVTPDYEGTHFFVRREDKLWVTPLFLVVLLIEVCDVVFAVDSIPAIFAVTQDTFIVFTSNVFAVLGLRALYFALAGLVHRFHYLKYGLALVLVVIGVKMLIADLYHLPTWLALAITGVLIGGSVAISLLRPADEPVSRGWVPGSSRKPKPAAKK
ncbi:MAG TPA: TerC family protein [Dongiaceae bacterium]|jgi:tellurite resistance protein TerC|nr:TerC family protein [Dongiaceae bacterium]